jgi:hypothetical protein
MNRNPGSSSDVEAAAAEAAGWRKERRVGALAD